MEPGAGKTALLDYARSRKGDLRVLTAQGIQSESEVAYAGLDRLLAPVIDRTDQLEAADAAILSAALGQGEGIVPDRFAVALAVQGLLATVAESGLLAVVDDLQWLDRPSGEALAFVARRLSGEGIAMLMARRSGAS